MKVCLRCGYMGDEEYCPACRRAGKIRKLQTAEMARYDLARELRRVEILKCHFI